MNDEVHNVVSIAKFIVILLNELDNMVIEGNPGPNIKDRGICVTVKLIGNNLVLCVGQDVLKAVSVFAGMMI